MKKFSALRFYKKLQPLLNHGVMLDTALNIIQNTHSEKIQLIHQKIKSGTDLSAALSQQPKLFSTLDCALIQAGESCGRLPYFIDKLIEYHSKRLRTRNEIKKALFYPAFVFVTSLLITLALLIFVIPQFQTVFASFNAPLPFITQCVINFSDFLQHDGILLIIFLLLGIGLIKQASKNSSMFREFLQLILFKMPLLGQLVKNSNVSLICYLLGTTQQSGIPLLASLRFSIQAIPILDLQKQLQQIQHLVENGQLLSIAFQHAHLLDSENIALLTISEQTGQLADTLKAISQRLADNTAQQLELINKLIEPIIMLLLALIIGGLIIAMYLPIFTIGAAIQ